MSADCPYIALCLFHYHNLGIKQNIVTADSIDCPYLCDYCRVIDLKPNMPAKILVTIYESEPVCQAIKFHAAYHDSQYAYKEQEKTIENLLKKCEILKNHIRYQPGGEGALEALLHWKELNNES